MSATLASYVTQGTRGPHARPGRGRRLTEEDSRKDSSLFGPLLGSVPSESFEACFMTWSISTGLDRPAVAGTSRRLETSNEKSTYVYVSPCGPGLSLSHGRNTAYPSLGRASSDGEFSLSGIPDYLSTELIVRSLFSSRNSCAVWIQRRIILRDADVPVGLSGFVRDSCFLMTGF